MDQKKSFIEPFFDLKITDPKISIEGWKSLMTDKISVKIRNLSVFLTQADNAEKLWVNAGVLVAKSQIKEAQNGSKFVIWTLSDLKDDLKCVTLFLFGDAYQTFWKTEIGTIVAVLQPKIGKKDSTKSDTKAKSEASFSVNASKNITILGVSADLGFCKSKTKNGNLCNKFLNKNAGVEFCSYHLKSEYNKLNQNRPSNSIFKKRFDEQFGNKSNAAPKNPNGNFAKTNFRRNGIDEEEYQPIVVAKRCPDLIEKDKQILKSFQNDSKESAENLKKLLSNCTPKIAKNTTASSFDTPRSQKSKDATILKTLKNHTPAKIESFAIKENLLSIKPTFRNEDKSETIDLNAPISRRLCNSAKLKALEYIKLNGKISDSTKVKRKIEVLTDEEQAAKKFREANDIDEFQKRYEEVKNMKSRNEHLVEAYQSEQKEKYFKKLEVKEKIEQKLLDNFKVPCKAVKCVTCDYTSYSASESCKTNRHTIKVYDSFKRFFKCKSCSKRTVTLDAVFPTTACTQCQSNSWEHCSVIKEKIIKEPLLIRGHEELFLK